MTVAVVNARTLGIAEWDLAWLDVAEHEGVVYGLTETGIKRLDGADDEGAAFAAYIEPGDLTLVPGGSASLSEARVTVLADAALQLTATAHQSGGEREVVYGLPARSGAQARDRAVKLGRGVMGNAWRFRLGSTTQAACAWSLSAWQVLVDRVRLRRR